MLSGHRLFFDSGRLSRVYRVERQDFNRANAGYERENRGTAAPGPTKCVRFVSTVGCVFNNLQRSDLRAGSTPYSAGLTAVGSEAEEEIGKRSPRDI